MMLLAWGAVGSAQTGNTTVITGTVYSPKGPTAGDPIPNILVFVAGGPLSGFTSAPTGPGVTNGCSGEQMLVSGNPVVSATTDFQGNFTLSNAALTALGTTTVNLVIQAGKWRRQYPQTSIVGGQLNALPGLSMPGASGTLADGSIADLPHIAVVTGAVDGLECIFPQIGISTSEITNPDGPGSINLYAGSAAPGAVVTASTSPNPTPPESTLVNNPALMNTYDLIMFACQGTPYQPIETNATIQGNIKTFADNGGRIFTTHWQYLLLDSNASFPTVADWLPPPALGTTASSNATINTSSSFTEGVILADWMHYIKADTGTLGQIVLKNTAVNTSAVHVPPSQSWATLNNVAGNPSMQFTFDTPIGLSGVPTVAIAYTNTTQVFKPGDTNDSITIATANTSVTDTDATLTMTLTLPASLTATGLADSGGGSWSCNATTLVCTRSTPLSAGSSDSVTLTFNIAATAMLGQTSITAALSGGNLSKTSQCGRVLYNDYHVEQQSMARNTIFPSECSTGALTAQEKFLEFSLYNLSNFVSPIVKDIIDIQGTSIINWLTPAPIYYGTPLSGTQLDATADVPGAFVYTPPAGTLLPVGTTTLSTVFTPADTLAYLGASASVNQQVLPDTTATTITNIVSPIYYGQTIADLALEQVGGQNGAAVDGGFLNFLIDGAITCTLPANIAGVCPPTTGAGYSAGTHTIQSVYTGDANFAPSSSAIYNVVVLPDPTSTALSTPLNPAIAGQPIPLTATVGDIYAPALGPVKFFDGATLIGTGTVNAQGIATLVTTTLYVGSHSLTACFQASLNFNGSCSAPTPQVISAVPSLPLATVTLLTSSLNPSTVGQSVTFNAVTETTGAFVAIPIGSITFNDGATPLATIALDATGKAAYSTTALTVGVHTITAAYAFVSPVNVVPPFSFAPSVSAPVKQVVNGSVASAGYGFVMTVTPTALSGTPGISSTVTVTITDLNGFNLPVALTCAGLPYEASCNFAQKIIGAGGGTTALVVSPTPPRPCSALAGNRGGPGSDGPRVPWLAALSVAAVLARKRRKLLQALMLALALCVLPMLNGCSTGCADLGTQPGSYSFTVTGTAVGNTVAPPPTTPPGSAALVQTQTMTMQINP